MVPYFLAGEDALAILEEANGIIRSDFNDSENLQVLNLDEIEGRKILTGSNSLVLPIVQRIFPERRIGRPEDIQKTLNDGDTIGIEGRHYVDLGVVLDFSGRNHEIARDFYGQLPGELKDLDRMPTVVVGYDLKNFDGGRYNLGLVHQEKTELRHASVLSGKSGNFSNTDVSLSDGMPQKAGEGKRRLWTASQKDKSEENLGLLGLYVNGGDLSLDACSEGLDGSSGDGRVVLF